MSDFWIETQLAYKSYKCFFFFFLPCRQFSIYVSRTMISARIRDSTLWAIIPCQIEIFALKISISPYSIIPFNVPELRSAKTNECALSDIFERNEPFIDGRRRRLFQRHLETISFDSVGSLSRYPPLSPIEIVNRQWEWAVAVRKKWGWGASDPPRIQARDLSPPPGDIFSSSLLFRGSTSIMIVFLTMRTEEKNLTAYNYFSFVYDSSVESQKGVTAVQRCSAENQKGAIAVQSLWR